MSSTETGFHDASTFFICLPVFCYLCLITIKEKEEFMETFQLNLTKQQVANLFQSMNEKDKLELFRELRQSLFVSRFDTLLNSLRTDELSDEDIALEVETVRKKHYESGKNLTFATISRVFRAMGISAKLNIGDFREIALW